MRLRALVLPSLVAVLVAAAGLALGASRPPSTSSESAGTGSARSAGSSGTVRITIHDYAYHPAALTVKVGTQVVVTNTDQTAHTLTARSGAFDTGTLGPGKTARFRVTRPGRYPYYCQFHAFMNGTLTVVR